MNKSNKERISFFPEENDKEGIRRWSSMCKDCTATSCEDPCAIVLGEYRCERDERNKAKTTQN